MRSKCTLLLSAFVLLAIVSLSGEASAQTRKMRFVNSTSDADVIVKCVGLSGTGFTLTIPQGGKATQSNVATGDRGFIIWEDFNNKVVVTGNVQLSSNNVIVQILGDATNGYNTAVEVVVGDFSD